VPKNLRDINDINSTVFVIVENTNGRKKRATICCECYFRVTERTEKHIHWIATCYRCFYCRVVVEWWAPIIGSCKRLSFSDRNAAEIHICRF